MNPSLAQLQTQVITLATQVSALSTSFSFHKHLGTDGSQILSTAVLSFNTRVGNIVLISSDVTSALGYTPLQTTINTIQTYTPASAGTATLDLSKGDIHHITMPAGNITIAISNATTGQCFIIRILQDSVGSRTVTWFTTIKWAGGVAPSLTATASKADTFGFEVTGTGTYDGFIVGQNL